MRGDRRSHRLLHSRTEAGLFCRGQRLSLNCLQCPSLDFHQSLSLDLARRCPSLDLAHHGCRVRGSFIVTASEHLRRGFAELEMTTYPTGMASTAGDQAKKGADKKCNGSTHVNGEGLESF